MFIDARDTDDRNRTLLLLKVARRYYLGGASQQDIADEIGYSRPTVSRMLDEARQWGIVHIEVSHPLERMLRLEQDLAHKFGLADARVVTPSPEGANNPTSKLAECAARYVSEITSDTSVIAVSNGSTISTVVDAFQQLHRPDSWIVQMIGTLGRENPLTDSPDICRRMAQAFGGRYMVLPAPLVVGTKRLASALYREDTISTTLAMGSRADVALLGIGATGPNGSGPIFDGWMTPAITASLRDKHAVGHLCGHHYDPDGNHIVNDLCQRVMSVPIERLRDIPRVVAVAYGTEKSAAIRGALNGKYVDVLITDATTAQEILAD
ncbi:MAG: sugar-binding transcriptional regulator [Microbacteriaceae bacterium]|nr:MAG: sugar-binding transcriptional regulator [Microbacteriaceae bacterium]